VRTSPVRGVPSAHVNSASGWPYVTNCSIVGSHASPYPTLARTSGSLEMPRARQRSRTRVVSPGDRTVGLRGGVWGDARRECRRRRPRRRARTHWRAHRRRSGQPLEGACRPRGGLAAPRLASGGRGSRGLRGRTRRARESMRGSGASRVRRAASWPLREPMRGNTQRVTVVGRHNPVSPLAKTHARRHALSCTPLPEIHARTRRHAHLPERVRRGGGSQAAHRGR